MNEAVRKVLRFEIMTELYEHGYRRIAHRDELTIGEPRLFRSGGAMIVLLRSHFGVRAADATRCLDASKLAAGDGAIAAVAECLRGDRDQDDWDQIIASAELPAELRDGAVWVCVDQCAAE